MAIPNVDEQLERAKKEYDALQKALEQLTQEDFFTDVSETIRKNYIYSKKVNAHMLSKYIEALHKNKDGSVVNKSEINLRKDKKELHYKMGQLHTFLVEIAKLIVSDVDEEDILEKIREFNLLAGNISGDTRCSFPRINEEDFTNAASKGDMLKNLEQVSEAIPISLATIEENKYIREEILDIKVQNENKGDSEVTSKADATLHTSHGRPGVSQTLGADHIDSSPTVPAAPGMPNVVDEDDGVPSQENNAANLSGTDASKTGDPTEQDATEHSQALNNSTTGSKVPSNTAVSVQGQSSLDDVAAKITGQDGAETADLSQGDPDQEAMLFAYERTKRVAALTSKDTMKLKGDGLSLSEEEFTELANEMVEYVTQLQAQGYVKDPSPTAEYMRSYEAEGKQFYEDMSIAHDDIESVISISGETKLKDGEAKEPYHIEIKRTDTGNVEQTITGAIDPKVIITGIELQGQAASKKKNKRVIIDEASSMRVLKDAIAMARSLGLEVNLSASVESKLQEWVIADLRAEGNVTQAAIAAEKERVMSSFYTGIKPGEASTSPTPPSQPLPPAPTKPAPAKPLPDKPAQTTKPSVGGNSHHGESGSPNPNAGKKRKPKNP